MDDAKRDLVRAWLIKARHDLARWSPVRATCAKSILSV